MTHMGKIIINSTIALTTIIGVTTTLAGIVYADREKQLQQVQVLADKFHEHEIVAKDLVAKLSNHQDVLDERVLGMGKTLDEVRKDIKTILERTR